MIRATLLGLGLSLMLPAAALAEDVLTSVDPVDVASEVDAPSLVQAAGDRIVRGDLEGADLMLDQAEQLGLNAHLQVEVAYLRANILALQRRYVPAREAYQAIAEDHPDSHRALDAEFRAVELTAALGEPKQALRGLRRVRRADGLEPADEAKIAFDRAIFTLEAGRERRGRRRFQRALRKHESGLVSFHEAKAWVALTEAALDRLDDEELRGSQRRMKKTIARRAAGLQQAEQALRQTVALQEPEWILAGLLRLSESYEDFGDDLLDAPEPDLTPNQLRLYREELAAQAEGFWIMALKYLDAGDDVGERLQWESSRVGAIAEERARLVRKIESGTSG